jgi:gamma-glutamyltranspeptidase/glutathione hydrolase
MTMNWRFPYPSRRMPVFAQNAVATSQPLAAQAGLQMLQKGGNAVDAALAAAITLTVVEPVSNGIGSDAFALVWDGSRLHGFNGSGRSPRAWSSERFCGQKQMPALGWDAVTVPGAVDTWVQLSRRFGRLPFGSLFEPAVSYAQDGFLVSPITAARWAEAKDLYPDFADFKRTFLPKGRAPLPGERFCCKDQARTLSLIAESNGEAFYRGPLAEAIIACSKDQRGAMAFADLADHHGDWVDPLGVPYHGRHLWEIPPNGQGLAALIALGLLSHWDLTGYPVDSADSIHLQVEAMKIAFAEVHRHVADPEHMAAAPEAFLQPDFLRQRASEISLQRAARPTARIPTEHGTVYLTAADRNGMLVSFIQSNYRAFGSGVVIPHTGISLQCRGAGFVTTAGHPNCVAGGKRPFHTIIPAFVTQAGRPLASFGVMGMHMQPQGHVQMMVRLFDYGQNPQSACDAPRWHVSEDFRLALEPGFDPQVIDALDRRGHLFLTNAAAGLFGGGQLIYCLPDGYCAASDPRKDGQAVGF